MREYATPAATEAPTSGNLTDAVVRHAAEAPDAVVLSRRTSPGGPWEDVTAAAFRDEVVAVAKGLLAAGVGPGDRVALMSRTRWEWTLLDYAAWFAGAVTVPVYETSSPEQLAWVLGDSGAVAAVLERPDHLARLDAVRDGLPALRTTWCLDAPAGAEGAEGTEGAVAALVAAGRDVDDAALEARRTAAGPDDLATLVYTSGTTGRPRGCELTHGAFLAEVAGAAEALPHLFADEDASTLLLLPLAHVFARVVQVGCVERRVRLGHSADAGRLVDDLAGFGPTFLLGVPRVFEKVFTTASQRAAADGRGRVFDRAAEVAIAWSRAVEKGRVPVRLRAQHALLDRLVYDRVREALGGARYAVSGGAPLGDRLAHFYRGVGTTVLEGYGLTETTAAVTVNQPDALRIGSVGRPLPGVAVRVDDDGELLVRGRTLMRGYHGDPGATAEVLTPDGWLRTGDVGEVDDEGFVRITGRKKEILVTAGGKNVAPSVLEELLRAHPLVGHCLVVGDGRPYIAALVTIDPEAWPAWAEQHGKRGPVADHVDDPDLLAAVQEAVDAANAAVSKAEAVRRFTVLPEDWTEEGGQLTPSLKLKRGVVARQLRREVDALYD